MDLEFCSETSSINLITHRRHRRDHPVRSAAVLTGGGPARSSSKPAATNLYRSLPALNRRNGYGKELLAAGLALILTAYYLAGCDYSPPASVEGTGGRLQPGLLPARNPGANKIARGPAA